jgi:thiamine-phosphate diphosphorylase/hydroxyethylthiazole kinase
MRTLELLQAWQPAVIKGNAAEIGALAESSEVCLDIGWSALDIVRIESRGVDSVGSGFANPANVVKSLARKKSKKDSSFAVDSY